MTSSIFEQNKAALADIIKQISQIKDDDSNSVSKILNRNKLNDNQKLTKSLVLQSYKYLTNSKVVLLTKNQESAFLKNCKIKKVRTSSGVTPVTVMTKPYPCPGKCIYCPNEIDVPKSYISNEPGAQRAVSNLFDPYLQTYNRLVAYNSIGHNTDKVELIVIGGTWSYYPKKYRMWFIKRCFEALNEFKLIAQRITPISTKADGETATFDQIRRVFSENEKAHSRCVGLSIETRPDYIDEEEVILLRRLGVTKVQLGVQSLNEKVLTSINRGHGVKEITKAFALLRLYGFKIQAHWMPNLPGSDVKKDLKDYIKLVTDSKFIPDEIKIYPCSLIQNTPLYSLYKLGKWKPYTSSELKSLLKQCLLKTPRFIRISRMIRDISSEDIIIGNRKSNLRQEVEMELNPSDIKEIRFREIRNTFTKVSDLNYKETIYKTATSNEYFLEMIDKNDQLAGFLRLSLYKQKVNLKELESSAIIREIHVYGPSLSLGESFDGKPQHSGIGIFLVDKAKNICVKNHIPSVAVISSVGTRPYYRKIGFTDGTLYQHLKIPKN